MQHEYLIGILVTDSNQVIALITWNWDRMLNRVIEFHFIDRFSNTRYHDSTKILGSGNLEYIRMKYNLRMSVEIMGKLLSYNVKIIH